MNASKNFYRFSFVLLFTAISICLYSQDQKKSSGFVPQVGQAGKDVIWVPTPFGLVDKMLEIAKVTPADYLIDLGSGDGRTVIAAAKLGARATGIEFNPDMVALSKKKAGEAGVSDKATFLNADLFESDLSKATVITMFLLPEINLQLRPKILDMKPGTRVVTNSFDMSDWIADQTSTITDSSKCSEYCTAMLWIVPAKVQGTWKLAGGELELEQTYQNFSGKMNSGTDKVLIKNGKIVGDQITFVAGDTEYTGRVNGNSMQGRSKSGNKTAEWSATRVSKAAQAPAK